MDNETTDIYDFPERLKSGQASPPPLTERYNVKYGSLLSDQERQILETVKESSFPLPPIEIAKITKLNPNSVRVHLKKLKAKGFLACPFRGYYQTLESIVTQGGVAGASAVLPRCHKLVLVVRGVGLGALGREVWSDCGLFRVVASGFENGVVVYVDCKRGFSFDYAGLVCLVELVKLRLSVAEDRIEVRSFEINSDFRGIQLDGVQCVTLKDFSGAFERFYNKGAVLRKEANVQRCLPLESAYLLLNGGVTPFQVFQANYQLIQEAKDLIEAHKFGNRALVEAVAYLRRLVEKTGGSNP